MPEALATTKRKFHKLLDSRFGSPSAPAATPPRPVSQGTISEPATKRIRSSGSTTSLSASLRNKTVPKTSINPVRGEPNFAPWSHDAFIKRLRSFGPVTNWHPKPDAINEVEWAKRGWWCVDTNTVGCKGGCQQRVVVKVEPIVKRRRIQSEEEVQEQEEEEQDDDDEDDNQEELEQALVEKYKELIVEGHSEDCLWRKAGCKDDIYRLPIVKSTVWQPELRTRYQSLLRIAPSLANLTLQPTELSPSPEKILANLPTVLLEGPEGANSSENEDTTEETKQKALKVAICGWQGSTESSTQLFACEACFQRIGLWMYQPDYKPPRFDDDDEEEQDRSLDLIQLHREHCPWRNPTTQAATGNYAGRSAQSILLDVLDRYIDEQRRRSRGTVQGPATAGNDVESDAGATDDGRESLALETLPSMPELSRAETEKHDKERLSKLRRLKTVLGFKRRAPPAA